MTTVENKILCPLCGYRPDRLKRLEDHIVGGNKNIARCKKWVLSSLQERKYFWKNLDKDALKISCTKCDWTSSRMNQKAKNHKCAQNSLLKKFQFFNAPKKVRLGKNMKQWKFDALYDYYIGVGGDTMPYWVGATTEYSEEEVKKWNKENPLQPVSETNRHLEVEMCYNGGCEEEFYVLFYEFVKIDEIRWPRWTKKFENEIINDYIAEKKEETTNKAWKRLCDQGARDRKKYREESHRKMIQDRIEYDLKREEKRKIRLGIQIKEPDTKSI